MSESTLQQACIKYLHLRYKSLGLVMASFPNEARRSPREAQRLKRMGMAPGMPDLVLFWKSKALFIEFKWGKNKLTERQELMHKLLIGTGFVVWEIRDFDTFQTVVDEFILEAIHETA